MSYGSIYKIEFPNGKHYIGQTNSLERRKKAHNNSAKRGDTQVVYNALRRYNMIDTFELIVIDTADTLEELNEKEKKYIIEYNSYYMNERGYNMTYGGDGIKGYVFTQEDKLVMSKKQTNRNKKKEERQKASERAKKMHEDNPNLAKEHSERMKKRHKDNPNLAKEQSERLKNHYDNLENRQKASERAKKRCEKKEERERLVEIRKKYLENNPEALREHSEKLKKRHKDNPDLAKERGKKLKAHYDNNPEAREKASERAKKMHEDNPEMKKKRADTLGENKPFDVFTTDGTFIKTFTYQFEASEHLHKEYNINPNSRIKIGHVLSGKRLSSHGFVFKYKSII